MLKISHLKSTLNVISYKAKCNFFQLIMLLHVYCDVGHTDNYYLHDMSWIFLKKLKRKTYCFLF